MRAIKADFAHNLRQCMQDALDWQDLHSFLAQVDSAFQQGDLAATEAEDLARFSIELSRRLPEDQSKFAA